MCDAFYARVSLLDAAPIASPFSSLTSELERRFSGAADAPAVRDDAFALGMIAGRREADTDHAAERAQLLTLFTSAAALQPEPSEELATLIAVTVERLVTSLVGAVAIDRDWMMDRIIRAVSIITEADAAHTLWLHPDDAELVAAAPLPLQVVGDPTLERGALRIGCSAGWIEDGRSLHLAALHSELGLGDPA